MNEGQDISIGKSAELKEPEIMLHREDGIVESIDVICSCGRKMHIVCEYEEPQENAVIKNPES